MAFTEFHYYSETLEIDVSVNVILPETRIMAQQEGKPLPTLYLLHGLSDDHTHWVRQTRLEFYARKYRLAIIMPCVNRSFYTDMKRGAKYFTFVSEELPRVMEMYFPLSSRREDRFAAGLSMGGYGATKLGLRLPERYAAIASLSGALDKATTKTSNEAHSVKMPKRYRQAVFGESGQIVPGSDNDLRALLKKRVEEGADLPALFHTIGEDDFLREGGEAYIAYAKELGVEIKYTLHPGVHDWNFWDSYIKEVLDWLPLANDMV